MLPELQWYYEANKTAKEQHSMATEGEDEPFALHVFRRDDDGGLEPIATLICDSDPEKVWDTIQVAGAGMNAEALMLTYEALATKEPVNPITGQPWEPGDLQTLFNEYPEAKEKGWVMEGLTTLVCNRAGQMSGHQDIYTKGEGSEVVWNEEYSAQHDSENLEEMMDHDAFFEILHHTMVNMQSLRQRVDQQIEEGDPPPGEIDLDSEETLLYMDVATVKNLDRRDLVVAVMLQAHGHGERYKVLKEAREKVQAAVPEATIHSFGSEDTN